jgi:hypothetical protein
LALVTPTAPAADPSLQTLFVHAINAGADAGLTL